MPYESVTQPMTVAEAFGSQGDKAYQSQAAMLLILGGLVHFGESETVGVQAHAADALLDDFFPPEDLEALGIPASVRRLALGPMQRHSAAFVRESIRRELMEVRERDEFEDEENLREPKGAIPRLADRVLEDPSPLTAAQLCAAALASPDGLVRVAAATSFADMTLREDQGPLVDALERESYSREPLVLEIALTSLARLAPDHHASGSFVLWGRSI